jgi:MFS family permease
VVSFITGGFIADRFGWEAIFYIHGGLAAIWLIFWAVFITSTPETNRFMPDTEKQYIAANCVKKQSTNEDSVIKLGWQH